MNTEPADTLDPEEVTIETPAGTVRWQDFIFNTVTKYELEASPTLTKFMAGSYFDHPDCRIAVDDYEEIAG